MRSASPRWGNVTTTRRLCREHPGELVLGLGETSRCDRRPLSLEHVCLGARQRVEPCGPLGRLCLEPLLLPDAHDVVELPDEVGSAVEEGNATLGLGGSGMVA